MIQVAVIDDGIDREELADGAKLLRDLVVDGITGEVRVRRSDDARLMMHGTVCAKIIESGTPEAGFISICIFDAMPLQTRIERLFAALEWCLRERVLVVHMSVGTQRLSDYGRMQPVIAAMSAAGQVIIASESNRGGYTAPAHLGGVIGVSAEETEYGKEADAAKRLPYRIYGNVCTAPARHCLRYRDGAERETPTANSYASPTVTAAVCGILAAHTGMRKELAAIYRRLSGGKDYRSMRPDFLRSAAVWNPDARPLCKEQFFFRGIPVGEELFAEEASDKEGTREAVLYIPSVNEETNRRALRRLEEKRDRLRMLVYCGVMAGEAAEKFRDILLWQETDCGAARWEERFALAWNGPETPVIFIESKKIAPVNVLTRLRDCFLREGYQCAAASDYPCAYLYGLEYIPRAVRGEAALQYLTQMYRPDLILMGVSGENEFLKDTAVKLVCAEPETVMLIREEEKERDNTDADALYQKIQAYFEEPSEPEAEG